MLKYFFEQKTSKEIDLELRSQVSNGLISLGNMAIAGLVFGQAFTGQNFSRNWSFIGVFSLIGLYVSAIVVLKGAKLK